MRRNVFSAETDFTLEDTRIAIVGLGLMGASLGLALKQRRVCAEVVGLVRRDEAVQQAIELGAVDTATTNPNIALAQADMVVLATPVRTIVRQLKELAPYCKPNAIITDMGSTKQEIVRAMALLPPGLQPVGSHPMCGKEAAGMSAAEATLYEGAPWIITPLERTAPFAVQAIENMAQAIGAKTRHLEAHRHDKLVATISHLPYLLATTLTLTAKTVANDDPAVWDVAASGFRDTSRVAASDVTMWLDILLTNRQAIGDMLALARARLAQFAEALVAGDEVTLRNFMEQAATQRKQLHDKK